MSGTTSITNTLLAGNALDFSGSIADGGFNLSGVTVAEAGLDPGGLRNNGGLTPTIALKLGSPAIDAGYELDGDQRDVLRPVDLAEAPNAPGSNASDIGAFELDDLPQTSSRFVVNTLGDHDDGNCGVNDCSLREAINGAAEDASHHDISFRVSGTIDLTANLPTINQDLTISGPENGLTISGAFHGANATDSRNGTPYYSLFGITGGRVTLENLTLTKGFGAGFAPAGAISAFGGTVVLRNLTLLSNQGADDYTPDMNDASNPSFPGGLQVQGANVTAINCTWSDNRGGSFQTIFAERGKGGCGAVFLRSGSLALVHCTIADNTGGDGAATGTFLGGDGGTGGVGQRSGTLILANSVVSRNTGGRGGPAAGNYNPGPPPRGMIGDRGATGEADTSGTIAQQGSNLIGGSAGLGALADNGGPNLTYLPGAGSVLVNAGDNDVAASYGVTTDARGLPRPIGARVEIGAVEVDVAQIPNPSRDLVVTTADDHSDGVCGVNDCTLREAITDSNKLGGSNQTIRFDPSAFATRQTISITISNLPAITSARTITAPAAGLIIERVSGVSTQADSVLVVSAGTVTISGLTIRNSNDSASGTNSVGIGTNGNTTLQNCTFEVSGSIAAASVGGGTARIQNCTFVGGGGSAGVFVTGGVGNVQNCTVTGNNVGLQNSGGTLNYSNSLVVGNAVNLSNGVTSGGFNITSGTPAAVGLDPAGLKNNGGPSQTIALVPSSRAINTGDTTLTVDQRGIARPQGGADDIGAFELTLPPIATGGAIINEYRLGGPNGASDEFIELYNQTGGVLNLSSWSVVAESSSGNVPIAFPVNLPAVPAYGRLLLTGSGYSLANYGGAGAASGDFAYSGDIAVGAALTLKNAAGDAVDVVSSSGLPSPLALTDDYSYVRRMDGAGGAPLDTNNDTNDFNLVDVQSTIGPNNLTGVSNNLLRLGAPGPQNRSSPIVANQLIKFTQTGVTRTGSGNSGTLIVRATVQNGSNRAITALRFRTVGVTAGTAATNTSAADIRLTSSTSSDGVNLPLSLQNPPAQPNGGGLNATVSLSGLPSGGLAAGATVSVEFAFTIVKTGTFRYLLNLEPVTASTP